MKYRLSAVSSYIIPKKHVCSSVSMLFHPASEIKIQRQAERYQNQADLPIN